MTVRQRPINWSLLVNPTSQGLQAEVDSSRNLANAVLGAGSDIGAGIIRGRQERESKRRFDTAQALSRDEFSLRKEEFEERKRERQANESAILDALTVATGTVHEEAAATGEVSPQSSAALGQLTDAAGGPQVAAEKLAIREARPDAETLDFPSVDLYARADEANRRREVAHEAMEAARRALSPNALKKPADREKARLAYQTAFNAWTKAGAEHASLSRRAGYAREREGAAARHREALELGEAQASRRRAEQEREDAVKRERERRDLLEVYADRGLEGDPSRLTPAELKDRIELDDRRRQEEKEVRVALAKDAGVRDPNYRQAEADRLAREGRRTARLDADAAERDAERDYLLRRDERLRLEAAARVKGARKPTQTVIDEAIVREREAREAMDRAREKRLAAPPATSRPWQNDPLYLALPPVKRAEFDAEMAAPAEVPAEDALAKARAEYDTLPDRDKTPEAAARIAARHGIEPGQAPDRATARAIFDREIKARGLDPSSDAARKLAEDIKAGRLAPMRSDEPPPGLPAEALAEWHRLSPEGKAAVRARWGKAPPPVGAGR